MGWLIPVAVVLVGVGVFARARRRNHDQGELSEPVSGDWLAQARSRWSDHHW
jgi:cytochrome c-type biogenesis protein CcmH/NrfF